MDDPFPDYLPKLFLPSFFLNINNCMIFEDLLYRSGCTEILFEVLIYAQYI
jgi:hypothetical protein